ncbi:MAG: hypothetical protein Roseis2KO_48510 [Roseivirga sp.]
MKNTSEIELFNSIGKVHNQLYSFEKELKNHFPDLSFRFDLSMYSVDRKEWPESPIGITWEINIDQLDEVFFFEITHEAKWYISSELSKVRLETIETFFTLEFDEISDLFRELPDLLDRFQSCCKAYLMH